MLPLVSDKFANTEASASTFDTASSADSREQSPQDGTCAAKTALGKHRRPKGSASPKRSGASSSRSPSPRARPENPGGGKPQAPAHAAAAARGGCASSGSSTRGVRYDMRGFTDQCVQRYVDLSGKPLSALKKAPTPGLDDSSFQEADFESPGSLAPSAASILMKILYLARCCRFDLIHPVCSLAREVTKWNRACDKRLHRLVGYLHSTRTLSQEGYVGNVSEDLSILCYTDASFADDVQTSRSTSGCYICLVGSSTFMPINAGRRSPPHRGWSKRP